MTIINFHVNYQQVIEELNFRELFANNSSADVKLSKAQISKIANKVDFLVY